jgi:hypothetical protein
MESLQNTFSGKFSIVLFSNFDTALCNLLKLCSEKKYYSSHLNVFFLCISRTEPGQHQTSDYSVIGRQQIAISSSKQCLGQMEQDFMTVPKKKV